MKRAQVTHSLFLSHIHVDSLIRCISSQPHFTTFFLTATCFPVSEPFVYVSAFLQNAQYGLLTARSSTTSTPLSHRSQPPTAAAVAAGETPQMQLNLKKDDINKALVEDLRVSWSKRGAREMNITID